MTATVSPITRSAASASMSASRVSALSLSNVRATAPNAPKMDTTPHFLVHQRPSPGDGLSRERK